LRVVSRHLQTAYHQAVATGFTSWLRTLWSLFFTGYWINWSFSAAGL